MGFARRATRSLLTAPWSSRRGADLNNGRIDAMSSKLASKPEMARHLFGLLRSRLGVVERRFAVDPESRIREMAVEDTRRGLTDRYDGVFLYLAIIGMCEFFVTGGPILKVAFGQDFDPASVNKQYEAFLRQYVVNGIRKPWFAWRREQGRDGPP